MGRIRIELKKIANNSTRQVTFSKRRNGLIKKAYELTVLSDIDLCLVMFSPSDRLTLFSNRRIEDILLRYFNLPEEESGQIFPLEDGENVLGHREALISILNKIKNEDDAQLPETILAATKSDDDEMIEEVTQTIDRLHEELQTAEEQLSTFEPNPLTMTSLEELESNEQQLEQMLACVTDRMDNLFSNQASSTYNPYLQKSTLPFDNRGTQWFLDDGQSDALMLNELVSSTPARDTSSTGNYAMLQGTSSNTDLKSMMKDQMVYHPENEDFLAWKHAYASRYLGPSRMRTLNIFSPRQQHEEEEQCMGAMPQCQAETSLFQHEDEEQGLGTMPQYPREILSTPFQNEDEEQCMWRMPQGQLQIISPPIQNEDDEQGLEALQQRRVDKTSGPLQYVEGQWMGTMPQGQLEIFSIPLQHANEEQGTRQLPQGQPEIFASPLQHMEADPDKVAVLQCQAERRSSSLWERPHTITNTNYDEVFKYEMPPT